MSHYENMFKLLEESGGSMSAREIASELRIPQKTVGGNLSSLKKNGRIYISGWRRDDDGGRTYIRALYSAGKKRDAKKTLKPLTKVEYTRRYRSRKVAAVSSVFALGTAVDARRLGAVTR